MNIFKPPYKALWWSG